MRIINRARGSGKSTMLLNAAAVTGYPIIVPNQHNKEHLCQLGKENCIDTSFTIYTLDEWERIGPVYGNILIDELGGILNKILSKYLQSNVVAITMSEPMVQPKNKVSEKSNKDRLLLESDVIHAIDNHINAIGQLDDDISCILKQLRDYREQ